MNYIFLIFAAGILITVYGLSLNSSESAIKNIQKTDIDFIYYARYFGEAYNVAPEMILATIEAESSFNVVAVGDVGKSFGLMQIQENTVQFIISQGFSQYPDWKFTAEHNIRYGTIFISIIREQIGSDNWLDIREAYTLGITGWKKGKRNPRERARFEKILSRYVKGVKA